MTRKVRSRLAALPPYRLYAGTGVLVFVLTLIFARAFPGWLDGGLSAVLLYVTTGLLALLGVFVFRLLARPDSLIEAVATAAAVSVLLEGIVLTFAPGAYGTVVTARFAGAWLLYGAGMSLVAAILLETRSTRKR